MGEEPPPDAGRRIARSLGDHEPPIPDDLMERVFRTYEERKDVARRSSTSRTSSSSRSACTTRTRPRCAGVPRALPGVHGRRVPGRQPAPAVPPGALARRPRRPLRRRRRLPVDLLLHGRDAGVPARDAGAVPGRARRPPGGELPLDAGDPVGGEPPRPGAGRLGEGAARGAPVRRTEPLVLVQPDRRGGGGVHRRAGAPPGRRGRPVRGDGRPLPPERALGGLRGGVRPGRHPVPGARRGVHPPPGRAANAAAPARPARRLGDRSGRGGSPQAGLDRQPAVRPRRGGADAPGRPRPPACARGAAPAGLVGRRTSSATWRRASAPRPRAAASTS